MPPSSRRLLVLLLILAAGVAPAGAPGPQAAAGGEGRRIGRDVLVDKVRGGWAGQMIGVSFGAPTEFKSNGKIIEGPLPEWKPGNVENAIDQDDLYVEMTFAGVMDRLGLDATTEQYGEAFRTSEYRLWHANAGARRLLAQGVKSPDSGHPKYNVHANDIDFQIEADFIGLMTPGLPQEAAKYCDRVGRVMNHGDGLYGGLFVTGMYAAAFFENDVRRVVEAGLAMLPAQSGYARIVRDVLAWHREQPDDWKATWQRIQDTWDKDDACPAGSLEPFNIDARLNGAYIALGLLYGGGDVARTLDVTTRAGQDSDCNPSNALGVLGVMIGYKAIPSRWRSGIPALGSRKFAYTTYSFEDIVRSTVRRAELVVTGAGGTVTDTTFAIPAQAPRPPALEQWDMGVPQKRVGIDDPSWRWNGPWGDPPARDDGSPGRGRMAQAAGAEATFSFTGTGVTLMGRYAQDGGRADVFLDGQPAGTLDAWIPPRTYDDALWHRYGLADGPHEVRIVTTGRSHEESTGTRVVLWGAVTYR